MQDLPGSSPRMRGTELPGHESHGKQRFIPAHAGNSRNWSHQLLSDSVHPRACGEQFAAQRLSGPIDGSSPRMRGTVTRAPIILINYRFIPAHAGNSIFTISSWTGLPVHPRACGEQPNILTISSTECGSSPRMRGTAAPVYGGLHFFRFIPAHAGNSRTRLP